MTHSDVFDQRVLLLGIGGMLWRAWTEWLDRESVPYDSPTLEQFNFLRPQSIAEALDDRYGLVINAAGYTDVDGAESNEKLATTINATGVGQLASRCAALGCKLVHYSTDYVFDGKGTSPYVTHHPRVPLSVYGRTKAEGERQIEASGCNFLMVRTSWLYAPWGNNFVRTITQLAAERPQLRVIDDQRGRPTSARILADITARLLKTEARGIYHVTNGGDCTWYELASEIVSYCQLPCRVEACTTDEYPLPAERPSYSILDLSETEALIGPLPPWRESLHGVLDELVADESRS